MNRYDSISDVDALLENPAKLKHHIHSVLYGFSRKRRFYSDNIRHYRKTSSVLFILGSCRSASHFSPEPCLILNKRSESVRQPGDLCCPGGGISVRTDRLIAKILHLPGSPLSRWPQWRNWRMGRRTESRSLAILLAGALREGLEEMRLNPLGVDFLGPLPPQQLAMFRRIIYPMACWVPRQKKFFPNREVEQVVFIPLRRLLNPSDYALCRMQSPIPRKVWNDATEKDFPCFMHQGSEPLWGATFRITMAFLELVFGFRHPDAEKLPKIRATLAGNYQTGNRI